MVRALLVFFTAIGAACAATSPSADDPAGLAVNLYTREARLDVSKNTTLPVIIELDNRLPAAVTVRQPVRIVSEYNEEPLRFERLQCLNVPSAELQLRLLVRRTNAGRIPGVGSNPSNSEWRLVAPRSQEYVRIDVPATSLGSGGNTLQALLLLNGKVVAASDGVRIDAPLHSPTTRPERRFPGTRSATAPTETE